MIFAGISIIAVFFIWRIIFPDEQPSAYSSIRERVTLTPQLTKETPLPTSSPSIPAYPYPCTITQAQVQAQIPSLTVTWIDRVHVLITWTGEGNIFRLAPLDSPYPIYLVSGSGSYQIPNPEFRGDVKYQPNETDEYMFRTYDTSFSIKVGITGNRPSLPFIHFISLPIVRRN